MGLREKLGIKYAVLAEDGHPHCHNCGTDLIGQPTPRRHTDPVRCPACRAKNFPDLRGSSAVYRRREP